MIRKPLPRRATSIWDRPEDWPDFEPPGWVFIASAIKELGKGDKEAGKKKLRELCAIGRLRAAGRMRDGQLEELAAHQWNSDDCKKWFASLKVSLTDLMRIVPSAEITTHWLFIEKASLNAVVGHTEALAPALAPTKRPLNWNDMHADPQLAHPTDQRATSGGSKLSSSTSQEGVRQT